MIFGDSKDISFFGFKADEVDIRKVAENTLELYPLSFFINKKPERFQIHFLIVTFYRDKLTVLVKQHAHGEVSDVTVLTFADKNCGTRVIRIGTPDVPHVVDVEGAVEFLFDGLVGVVPPVQFLHGLPQVVQAVHEGLGHLIVEGDHVPARHVGVGVDGVVRRGGALPV